MLNPYKGFFAGASLALFVCISLTLILCNGVGVFYLFTGITHCTNLAWYAFTKIRCFRLWLIITLMVNRPAFSGFSNAKPLRHLRFLHSIFCVFCQCVSPNLQHLPVNEPHFFISRILYVRVGKAQTQVRLSTTRRAFAEKCGFCLEKAISVFAC
jgi:hypothetical protein